MASIATTFNFKFNVYHGSDYYSIMWNKFAQKVSFQLEIEMSVH